MVVEVHQGDVVDKISDLIAQLHVVEVGGEECHDDVVLELGESHTKAGMSCHTYTYESQSKPTERPGAR